MRFLPLSWCILLILLVYDIWFLPVSWRILPLLLSVYDVRLLPVCWCLPLYLHLPAPQILPRPTPTLFPQPAQALVSTRAVFHLPLNGTQYVPCISYNIWYAIYFSRHLPHAVCKKHCYMYQWRHTVAWCDITSDHLVPSAFLDMCFLNVLFSLNFYDVYMVMED